MIWRLPTLPSAMADSTIGVARLNRYFRIGKKRAKGIFKKGLKQKSPNQLRFRLLLMIWRLPTLPPVRAVPLALPGLTSLFGMGRGEHRHYYHHEIFQDHIELCFMNAELWTEMHLHAFIIRNSSFIILTIILGKLWVSNQALSLEIRFFRVVSLSYRSTLFCLRKVSGN